MYMEQVNVQKVRKTEYWIVLGEEGETRDGKRSFENNLLTSNFSLVAKLII